jgi:hypothetical protein
MNPMSKKIDPLAQAIGREFKIELARRGLPQRALAEIWNSTMPRVSAKLNARTVLSNAEFEQAAEALGFDPIEFMTRAQKRAECQDD